MYVTNFDDSTVSVINTNTNDVIARISVGKGPSGIAFDQQKRMYVSNFGNDTVSISNTNTNNLVSSPIKVGEKPIGITYIPSNHKYVRG